ncbi:DUF3536 domain-containing protein [Candidatus Magnetominusculus dajiuhuensis]|uniref:DUF3536 domain-containing protein n=1 Tax=Candidatus Magnetominusculus dajiuhuensis TaxID=3137712 RepID=UPI003B42A616
MEKYICIHGHFYQPPRENPWLEEVEYQDSAGVYHDWNERITAECYAPNAASKILDHEGRVSDIINNYSKISFNFGPTLLSWLLRHNPDVYRAILEADKLSIERFSGHGSAIAQVYNHVIMPLANHNDKITQVIWGIRDFQARFGRRPEGIWLAETAVDLETLDVLAENGILFTILAPRQASRVKNPGHSKPDEDTGIETPGPDVWTDVSGSRVDPAMPYLCKLPSGRTITLFFYDGPISSDIAFSGVLNKGENFIDRLTSAFTDDRDYPQLVNIATDGETYGHHHRKGEMALTYCLHLIESGTYHAAHGVKLANYGQYLEKHPPVCEVEIYDNSSWSCIHGIGRWMDDCGCNSGMRGEWTQKWRRPLREAMDWLRDRLAGIFEIEGGKYLKSPWDARNDYIEVILNRDKANVHSFIDSHAHTNLPMEDRTRVLQLLEMQRNSMLMYTSCGWFFDEISGVETVQVMSYAARAMQYAKTLTGISLEAQYIEKLRHAPSNVFSSGAYPYEMFVKPAKVDIMRAVAHFAISSLFESGHGQLNMFCYAVERQSYDEARAGRMRLATGKIQVESEITWEQHIFIFAVLHMGDHSVNCGVKEFSGDDNFNTIKSELTDAFEKGLIPSAIRLMQTHFGSDNYSIGHLFKDEQKRILDLVSQGANDRIDDLYRQIYESNYSLMNFYRGLSVPLPKSLSIAAAYILEKDLMGIFETKHPDIEKLKAISDELKRWNIAIDKHKISFRATAMINNLVEILSARPEDIELYENLSSVLKIFKSLSIKPDLWKAHNMYFIIGKELRHLMSEKAAAADESARIWLDNYGRLGRNLGIKP